jgi:hypothetical protein
MMKGVQKTYFFFFFIQSLIYKDNTSVEDSETYETIMFSSISQHVLSIVCAILGYDNDKVVDYTVL